jgi:hypothetical protein
MRKSIGKKKNQLKFILFIVGIILSVVALWYIFFGPIPVYDRGASSIDDLVAYAKSIDEFVPMENKDFLKPSYERYYSKKFSEGFIANMQARLRGLSIYMRLSKPPAFSFGLLKNQLEVLATQRSAAGFKGNCVQKIRVDAQSQIIIFGVLQGAYHSLTRSLVKLHELGKITKNFKLTDPNITMVFLGNVINRSPYTSETFMTVLALMKNNPKQVIYLKGTNEFDYYWVQHSLRRELELGAKRLSQEEIPLFKQVSAFFATLPLELYAVMDYKKSSDVIPYVAISAFIEDKKLKKITDEKLYPGFLREIEKGKSDLLDVDNPSKEFKEKTNQRIVLKAAVRDIRKRDSFEKMDGLRSMPPEEDALSWTILSCPTAPYRLGLKFMYDAFGVITGGKNFEDWKLTLYNRQVESKTSTFSSREVNFIGGSGSVTEQSSTKPPVEDKSLKDEKKSSTQTAEPAKVDTSEKSEKKIEKSEAVVKVESVAVLPPMQETKPVQQPITNAMPVASAGVTREQLAFYKELVSQVGSLKREVVEVRASILKELQKFEISDSSDKAVSRENQKPVEKVSAKPDHTEPGKKQALAEANKVSNKLEESIEKVLAELKTQRAGVTINNNVGAGVPDNRKEELVSDSKALVSVVNALRDELKQQRELIKNALVEE